MQCARSMLSSIAGIAARVIFVSIHQSVAAAGEWKEEKEEKEGETNLNSFVLPVSAPACHGIDSLATLMRVSSEVPEVGLRPASLVSLCFARFFEGGGLVTYRSRIQRDRRRRTLRRGGPELISVPCMGEGGRTEYTRRALDPASRPASAWFFRLVRQTLGLVD